MNNTSHIHYRFYHHGSMYLIQQSAFAYFIQYIRNQWIVCDAFTVRDLSVFQMTIRTNNDVEGYHYEFI